MKRLLLSLCVALTSLATQADNKSLFVTFDDGSRVEFALSTTPEVAVTDNKLTITSTATTASYELWTVKTFTYGTTTGINNVTANQQNFSISGDNIIVEGNATVRIFAIDGKAVPVTPETNGGQTIIPLDGLAKGVYVININGKSVKISRR